MITNNSIAVGDYKIIVYYIPSYNLFDIYLGKVRNLHPGGGVINFDYDVIAEIRDAHEPNPKLLVEKSGNKMAFDAQIYPFTTKLSLGIINDIKNYFENEGKIAD